MKIISLSGKAGSGKDATADILQEYLGEEAVNRCAYAAKLKKTLMDVFNLTFEQVYDEKMKDELLDEPILFNKSRQVAVCEAYGIRPNYHTYDHLYKFETPRKIMQYVGTDFLRGFNDKIHLEHLPLKHGKVNIVTDSRFPNEIKYLEDKSTHKDPPLLLYIDREDTKKVPDCKSEALTKEDFTGIVVDNNGTLRDLDSTIKGILNEWTHWVEL